MRIGLIDVDAESRGKVTYPNLCLMKLSAWHKKRGDSVEWHQFGKQYDTVYLSKVFSDEYTKDYEGIILADNIVKAGSGYAISIVDGREVHDKSKDVSLPDEVDHTFPDYSLYNLTDDAYGFLTRGCPRQCDFCHIASMQGTVSHTAASIDEFWDGQKTIHLYDPNILACKGWKTHFYTLAATGAKIDFNQGLDVRLLNEEKAEMLNKIKYQTIHFAWDRPEEDLRSKLAWAKTALKKCSKSNTVVYILINNGESFEEDVDRVEFVKSLRMQPYVMAYRGTNLSTEQRRLRRYANNPYVCWATPTFADYLPSARSSRFGKTGITHKQKIDWSDLTGGEQ